jgi:hypothetical protein
MFRTTWLALFCLFGLGAVMAVRLAAPPAAPVVDLAQDQRKAEPVFALDEVAKSDRLELRDAPAEAEIVVPSTQTMPIAAPSTSPVTISTAAEPRWQDANAMIRPAAPPHRLPKPKPPKKIVVKSAPVERAEAWHCRSDAVGGLLRSLDLSPRCNL